MWFAVSTLPNFVSLSSVFGSQDFTQEQIYIVQAYVVVGVGWLSLTTATKNFM